MQKEHLAIASVPIQEWGSLYEDAQALKNGTVFEELNMPFYVTCQDQEPEPAKEMLTEREELMNKINEVSFAVNDITLYMDTHCTDKKAYGVLLEKIKERKQYLQEFAKQYYPLTVDCVEYAGQEYDWGTEPIPWEGACI